MRGAGCSSIGFGRGVGRSNVGSRAGFFCECGSSGAAAASRSIGCFEVLGSSTARGGGGKIGAGVVDGGVIPWEAPPPGNASERVAPPGRLIGSGSLFPHSSSFCRGIPAGKTTSYSNGSLPGGMGSQFGQVRG